MSITIMFVLLWTALNGDCETPLDLGEKSVLTFIKPSTQILSQKIYFFH